MFRKPLKTPTWVMPLIEVASGPVIAIMFWFMIIIIAIMSVARGKFFEANFFEAFGAIGQVGFAGAVFLLGYQQFRFTQSVAARQDRIDTYAIKKEIMDRFATLYSVSKSVERDTRDEELYTAWYELADDVDRVIDTDVGSWVVWLAELLDELHGDSQYMRELNELHAGDLAALQAALKENWRKIEDQQFKIWWHLHQETTLTEKGIKLSREAAASRQRR